MRPLIVTVLTIAGITAALLASIVALVWWNQERIVFQPPRPPADEVTEARRIDYRAADGQPLFALLVEESARAAATAAGESNGGPLVLAFHGNADLAAWQVPWARELVRRTGARVLLAEYRGYGGLGGVPTYEASRLDARAAWGVARDSLGATPDAVTLYGHSLGSAVATELAGALAESGTPPRALVLQSPFTSARAMVRIVGTGPVAFVWSAISRVHYDSERIVRDLCAPVWVAHGERDLVVPVLMGRSLHDAARVKGELLVVPGAGHNDLAAVAGEAYWRWLSAGVDGTTAGH
ncbi:MAG: alpha/beta hydrolase [Gemmatimonadaceae bacterium]